jgi:hypothetical protein
MSNKNVVSVRGKKKIVLAAGSESMGSKGKRGILFSGLVVVVAFFMVWAGAAIGSMISPPNQIVLQNQSIAQYVYTNNSSAIPFANVNGQIEYPMPAGQHVSYIETNATLAELNSRDAGKIYLNLSQPGSSPSVAPTTSAIHSDSVRLGPPPVVFAETGLPAGTEWGITYWGLNSATKIASTSGTSISLATNTYSGFNYIVWPANDSPFPGGGYIPVGFVGTVNIAFHTQFTDYLYSLSQRHQNVTVTKVIPHISNGNVTSFNYSNLTAINVGTDPVKMISYNNEQFVLNTGSSNISVIAGHKLIHTISLTISNPNDMIIVNRTIYVSGGDSIVAVGAANFTEYGTLTLTGTINAITGGTGAFSGASAGLQASGGPYNVIFAVTSPSTGSNGILYSINGSDMSVVAQTHTKPNPVGVVIVYTNPWIEILDNITDTSGTLNYSTAVIQTFSANDYYQVVTGDFLDGNTTFKSPGTSFLGPSVYGMLPQLYNKTGTWLNSVDQMTNIVIQAQTVSPYGYVFNANRTSLFVSSIYVNSSSAVNFNISQFRNWDPIALTNSISENYSITFNETHLPKAVNWTVTIGNVTQTINTTSMAFYASNGTYSYSAKFAKYSGSNGIIGYIPFFNGSGNLTVNGSSISKTIGYEPGYGVTFIPKNLTEGTSWTLSVTTNATVNVSGKIVSSVNTTHITTTAANLTLPFLNSTISASQEINGTLTNVTYTMKYSYSISSLNYLASESASNFSVDQSGLTESVIALTEVAFGVTFTETGLPANTSWSISVNGAARNSSTSSILFSEPNGTYNYAIGGVTGYTTSSVGGSVTVNGSSAQVNITFSPLVVMPTEITIGYGTSPANFVPLAYATVNGSSVSFTIQPQYLTGNQSKYLMIRISSSSTSIDLRTTIYGNSGISTYFGPITGEEIGYWLGAVMIFGGAFMAMPWHDFRFRRGVKR